jgi:hypothetical protein
MDLIDEKKDKNGLLEFLEIADLRVYKIRGTDPRADMSYLARDAKEASINEIRERLRAFIRRFMGNAEFNRRLKLEIYPNPALKHIYIEFEEEILEKDYSFEKLRSLNELDPTVEHIFAREPTFDFPNHGFEDEDDFAIYSNTLGNLTLLEKDLNSKCSNRIPEQKIDKKFYGSSNFLDPRRISANLRNEGVPFSKRHIKERLKELNKFCMDHWRMESK